MFAFAHAWSRIGPGLRDRSRLSDLGASRLRDPASLEQIPSVWNHGWERATPVALMIMMRHWSGALPAKSSDAITGNRDVL